MFRSLRSNLALLACCLLVACGQKGSLYLPGDPSEVQTEIPEAGNDTLPSTDEDDEPDTGS